MKKFLFLFPLLLILSCNDSERLFDPTLLSDGFKGITVTRADSPEPLQADPSDWCYSNINLFSKGNTEVPVPISFEFGPCYPNPIELNGTTTIRFAIPEPKIVKVYIIDKTQKVLDVLIDEWLQAGSYERHFNTEGLPKGIYRLIMEVDEYSCKGDLWIK
jgi:hypothetical protein